MKKWKYSRPKFAARAAFKTRLRKNGFKVPRNFYGAGCCIAYRNARMWRFRFDDNVVDVSCDLLDFDRWANSTYTILDFAEFLRIMKDES